MNTDGTTYTEEETEELYGTTDSEVTPAVKHYDHFTSPSVKTDTINGDGSTVFEYLYSRDQYTLNVTDRTYVTAASSENGDYYYDEQITLSAVNRPGYTFSKWSNELTTQTIQFNISEDIEIYPIYTANTNTPYKVKHYKMDVDGVNYTLEETDNLTGTTDTNVTPAVKNYTHFTSPATQTDSIDGSGETVFEYYYTRDQYTLNVTDRTYVSSTSTANGSYYYETPITLTAVDRTGFEFTKWSNDETSQTYEFNISSNVTIYPIYTEVVVNQFTVTLNANGGTVDPTFIKVNEGSPVGVLPIPTNDDSTQEFDGWYTLSEGGDSVTSGFTPIADIEIFAHWTTVSRPLLCKKATDLHTENCNSTSGQGCLKAGFALDSPIKYGRLSVDSTYQPGDIFNCDVNGDGTYDSETERFYYMRTVDNKAVLIYYTNFEGTNGPGVTDNTIYDTALTKLPVTDPNDAHTWKNVDVTFGDYAARFPTREDFYAACGSNDLSSEGSLDACKFVMENTRFAYNANVTPTHRTAIWLEKEDDTLYRYMNSTRNIVKPNADSKNAARPVIEVSTSLMDTAPAYTITLNVNGGYGVPSEIIMFGGSVVTAETLPIPQRDLYDFVGWYSALDGGVECTPGYVVNSSMEIFARWQKKPTVTISFNSNGGEELDSIDVVQGQPVGSLPIPEYAGYTLEGWYTEPELENKVDSTFSTTSNVTLYAKWEEDVSNYVAVMNGTYYETVAAALTASPNNTKTTIKMIADSTETISIGSNKNIVLDLHNHTLSSGGKTITNSGTLEVKDGNLGSSANNIISSTGTVKVNNVIATSTAGSGAFDNDGGTMTIIDSRIYNNNNRQAVYNNGGTLYIQGNTYLYSKADRASLHNLNDGTTYLQSGTVESDSTCSDKCGAIYNELGTVVIGHNRDETVSTTNPVIKGKNVAIRNKSTLKFYDGIIKALTTLITDKTDYEIEDDCTELEGTETIGSDTYHTLTLSYSPTHYKILLEADGGIVSPTQFYVDIGQSIGDAIGELPIPTKGVYHFDGWYTGEDVLVTTSTVPTENDTYYAHWSYSASNEPVQFNLTNDVMSVYYQNIDTWKDLSESDFYTAMRANFDNYNCSVCEGENSCNNPSSGERCDHPKGYSTGTTDDLVVYTYRNNQKSEYPVTYTTSTNGVIYNMIPGETYYWESAEDSNINGLVAVSGNRRTIYTPIKNVRDLGGLRVSYTVDNVTTTGTTKYERLYRGAQLSTSQSDADSLTKLGIDREIDLRSISEGYSKGQAHLSKYDIDNPNATNGFDDIIIQNYLINPVATSYISSVNTGNYRTFKAALKATMRSIVNDENVFFHCTIGSDRTGTMAYFLEGLLGVSEEDRVQDYELSFFFGMVNRHRFHDDLVNTSIRPRFKAMHLSYPTNADIYNWYKYEPEADDDTLLEQFRDAMIIKD